MILKTISANSNLKGGGTASIKIMLKILRWYNFLVFKGFEGMSLLPIYASAEKWREQVANESTHNTPSDLRVYFHNWRVINTQVFISLEKATLDNQRQLYILFSRRHHK